MYYACHTKRLSGDVNQNEVGEVSIHLLTGKLSPKDEQELQEIVRLAVEAVRAALLLKEII
jgi:hypothetical protein